MGRAIWFHELGGPEVLRYEERPLPDPGPGEVRVRIDAIGLNRAEVNFRRGTYVEQPVLPAGLGTEAAGGADLVLDAEGGPQVEQLVAACAAGATVIVHGGLSGKPTPLPAGGPHPVWLRRYHVFEITTDPAAMRRAEPFVRSGLAAGALTPMVDRVFEFDDVVAAHRYLDSPDRRPGKPVLRVRR
jgi:NADPH:quinone reductase-like Zn-dependent oxidoreductase